MIRPAINMTHPEPLASLQLEKGLLLVNDGGNPSQLGGNDTEELVMVGLRMDDLDAVLLEPTSKPQHSEGIHPLAREDRNQIDLQAGSKGFLTEDAQASEADKPGLDPHGQILAGGEQKILGSAHRHRDKEQGNLHRSVSRINFPKATFRIISPLDTKEDDSLRLLGIIGIPGDIVMTIPVLLGGQWTEHL